MILLLAVAAILAQAGSPTLTLRQARNLSPRQLATRVLGMVGSAYREARVTGSEGGAFGDTGDASIYFASAPRASNPGMCIADTLWIDFSLAGDRRAGADRQMRLQGLVTNHLYRIVGDTRDRRVRSDEEERALEAQCARAGPVLADWTRQRFFGGQRLGEVEAFLAARMLQTVIAEARRGAVTPVTCTEDNPQSALRPCADPRSFLAGLSTDRLGVVALDRCVENATHLCANLTFRPGDRHGNEVTTLRVIVEVDIVHPDPPPQSFRVLAVTIRQETWIED